MPRQEEKLAIEGGKPTIRERLSAYDLPPLTVPLVDKTK